MREVASCPRYGVPFTIFESLLENTQKEYKVIFLLFLNSDLLVTAFEK